MASPWKPDDQRWGYLFLGVLVLVFFCLMFGGRVFGQGDPRPQIQTVPIMTIDDQGRLVVIGDFTNHALRVNVVAGSSGGPSGIIGAAFPSSVIPLGVADASGFLASLTLTNGYLNTTCNNCTSAPPTSYAAAFPSTGAAIGFKDGAGMLASGTVDNAGNLFVIASQGSSNWTVVALATGTISAHQADAWTVSCSNCGGTTPTNYGSTFPASGGAVGFKDGQGFLASATVDNAGFLLVTASQGAANAIPWNIAGTVTATGTISAHQADTWTVALAAGSSVNATQGTSPWVISGAVTQGTSPWVVSGTVTATGTVSAHQADTWTVGLSPNTSVIATGTVTAHQGDAWTVTANQGTSPWVVSGTVTATGTVSAHQADTWTVGLSPNTSVIATGTVTAHQGDTWTVALATGSNTIGALTANQSMNLAQVAGTTTVTGGTAGLLGVGGPTATGSQGTGNPVRVGGVVRFATPAYTDGQVQDLTLTTEGSVRVRDDAVGATATIAPSRVAAIGGWGQSATLNQVTVCDNYATVSLVQRGDVQVITGAVGHQIKICSVVLIAASATAINVVEGFGTLCATNRTGVIGSTATANGINLASTGGLTMGTGVGLIAKTQLTGSNLCIGNSTFATTTGGIMWTRY